MQASRLKATPQAKAGTKTFGEVQGEKMPQKESGQLEVILPLYMTSLLPILEAYAKNFAL